MIIGVSRFDRTYPRIAASTVRRIFRSIAASRSDPFARLRFSCDPDREQSHQEMLDGWWADISSVGSSGSTFDEKFFQSVSAKFDEVVSSPIIPTLRCPVFLI